MKGCNMHALLLMQIFQSWLIHMAPRLFKPNLSNPFRLSFDAQIALVQKTVVYTGTGIVCLYTHSPRMPNLCSDVCQAGG